jgi:hypothetical protein
MLKPFSRSNPCPICDGGADCRYSIDENLILCHGHIDFDPDHPDWHFTRPSDTGVWGIFVPRKDEPFDRSQWLEKKAERELKAKREREARALASLPIDERDKAIRSLSKYLGLSRRHRQALIDRGLTDEQIRAGLFFSINPGDRVPAGTPDNLAGVVDGKITSTRSGYACIVFDRHGRAIGWQTRLDDATDGDKYRWARGIHSSHLPSGELPIAVVNPTGDKARLLVQEGTLKPFVSAHRHSIACMGASGGWFDKSPEQIAETVAEYGELAIVPDAGDIANRSAMKRWERQIAFLSSLGKPLSIAWWGQRTKDDDDIDELSSPPRSIEFITPEEFFALTPERASGKLEPKKKPSLIERLIKRVRQFKGFGNPPAIEPIGPEKSIGFIPSIEEWESLGRPSIEYEGDPAKIWQEAISQGFGAIHDATFMGGGKSHGIARLANLDGKIWYLSAEHRNPSIPAIAEQFTDLAPRSRHGFYRDENGKLIPARDDTDPNLVESEGNCIRADLFGRLSAIGYSPNERDGKLNPICQTCPKANYCGITPGLYRHDRRETLKSHYIRLSIESLPREGYDFSPDILAIEEASRELKPTKTISTTHEKLLIELDRVRAIIPSDAYAYLDLAIQSLKSLYDKKSKYGHESDRVRDILPRFDRMDALIDLLEANSIDLGEVFSETDRIEGLGRSDYKRYREAIKLANRELSRENYRETIENLENLPPNALIHLLKLARGDRGIVARVNGKRITLTIEDRWYAPIFNQSKVAIFLDATAATERLKLLSGIDRPILTMRKKIDRPLGNLTIHQIEIDGLGSNDISPAAIERVNALTGRLRELHGEFPIVAFKAYQEAMGALGYWFRDTRSSNVYQGIKHLAFIGSPYPNVGAIGDEFLALTGSRDGFDGYYQSLVQSEQLQGIGGRQRCHRFPDREFHIWAIGTGQDLSWLESYGAKIEKRHGFEYTPEAGDRYQFTLWQITQAIRAGRDTGRTISEHLGKSPDAVSKFLREHGIELTELIHRLGVATHPIKDSIGWVAGHWELLQDQWFRLLFALDPIALMEEIATDIAYHGWEVYRREILPIFPAPLRGKIEATIAGFLLAETMAIDTGGAT